MTRCRLHRAEAVVWAIIAIAGLAVYAVNSLRCQLGLHDWQQAADIAAMRHHEVCGRCMRRRR